MTQTSLLRLTAAVCLATVSGLSILPGQESIKPAANPVPEGALTAPPAFGVSGPETPLPEPSLETVRPAVPDVQWEPKLQVLIRTKPIGDREQRVYMTLQDGRKSLQMVRIPSDSHANFVTLKCDDISVAADPRADGTQVYSLTCKGKAEISMVGNTITGESISTVEGKLLIKNAVTRMYNDVTLQSESMTLSLPIISVSVGSAADADAASVLTPTADPIGEPFLPFQREVDKVVPFQREVESDEPSFSHPTKY